MNNNRVMMKSILGFAIGVSTWLSGFAQENVCSLYTDEKIANYWQEHFENHDPRRTDSMKCFYFLADEHKVARMALWAQGHGFEFKKGLTVETSPESSGLNPYFIILSRPLAKWKKVDFFSDIRSLREFLYQFDPEWCGNGGLGYKP